MAMDGRGPLRVDDELARENDRYHRQGLVSWWSQDLLRRSRILVVGAGALGNEIVKDLALIGVGTIVVIDLDTVENSNLARCVMFRTGDDGKPKAELLAERAMDLNPDVRVLGVQGDVRHDLGLSAFIDADVVIGGLDNQEARLYVDGACWKTTTPWVDGAIEGLMGVMRVFVPPESASFESTMSTEDHMAMARRKSCALLSRDEMQAGKVPTTATSASVVAGMQVQEAVKLLHRDSLEAQFAGKGFVFNGMTHDSYVVTYTVRGDETGRDTYDLDDVEAVDADTTFGEMLQMGGSKLRADHCSLVLEREVVGSFTCSACESEERVNRPVSSLSTGAALCPACGAERRVEVFHRIGPEEIARKNLTMADLHFPPGDLITVATENERCFFLIGPEASPFHG